MATGMLPVAALLAVRVAEPSVHGVAAPPSPAPVYLTPADNVQHAVNTAPAGTTFIFAPGVYRNQGNWENTPRGRRWAGIRVKNNTILQAQVRRTATFSGAVTVNDTRRSTDQGTTGGAARHWVSSIVGFTDNSTWPSATGYGICERGFEACNYRQDLFFNGTALRRFPHRENLTLPIAGWFLDYTTSEAITNFDTTAGLLEISWQSTFISAPSGSNVTVRGLVIEKIANHAQTNTCEGADTVDDCEIRWAHGGGAMARVVTNNHIHHIGQLGSGATSLLENNIVEFCNYANYS